MATNPPVHYLVKVEGREIALITAAREPAATLTSLLLGVYNHAIILMFNMRYHDTLQRDNEISSSRR